jgi:Zn-dependent protease with chaperone function
MSFTTRFFHRFSWILHIGTLFAIAAFLARSPTTSIAEDCKEETSNLASAPFVMRDAHEARSIALRSAWVKPRLKDVPIRTFTSKDVHRIASFLVDDELSVATSPSSTTGRWTDEELASYERELRRGRALRHEQFAEIEEYLQGIMDRLGFRAVKVYVVFSKDLAFASTGTQEDAPSRGFVAVSTRLLRAFDSEDQIAYVLGHEAAHLEFVHVARKAASATGVCRIRHEVLALGPLSHEATRRLDWLLSLSLNVRSQALEKQADRRATALISKAGYPLSAGPDALATLAMIAGEEGTAREIDLTDSHPPVWERLIDENRRSAEMTKVPARDPEAKRRFDRYQAATATLR